MPLHKDILWLVCEARDDRRRSSTEGRTFTVGDPEITAERLLGLVRGQRNIESRQHWVSDVSFAEVHRGSALALRPRTLRGSGILR